MTFGLQAGTVSARPTRSRRGFSILELLIVLAIIMVTTVIAIPVIRNVSSQLKISGAVSTVKAGIQGTRYQSIYQGCPYQIVFTAVPAAGTPAYAGGPATYQVQAEPYTPAVAPATGGSCAAAFTNVCPSGLAACPVPLWGVGTPMALNADVTLQFRPGGSVTSTSFPGGGINMTLTYTGQNPPNPANVNIQVSNYGNITP